MRWICVFSICMLMLVVPVTARHQRSITIDVCVPKGDEGVVELAVHIGRDIVERRTFTLSEVEIHELVNSLNKAGNMIPDFTVKVDTSR